MPLLRVYDPSPIDFDDVEAFRLILADGRTVICEADPRRDGAFRILAYGAEGEPAQRHERPPLLHALIDVQRDRGEITYLRLESRGGTVPPRPPAPPVRIEFTHGQTTTMLPERTAALFLPDGRHIQVDVSDEQTWPGESGNVGIRAWAHNEPNADGSLGLPVADLYFQLSYGRADIGSAASRAVQR